MNVTPLHAPTTAPEQAQHLQSHARDIEGREMYGDANAPVALGLTSQPEAAPLTEDQQKAQAVLDAGDYATMIRESVQTLRAELYAAEFMNAELLKSRDVQNRKKKFLRAAGKLTGLLPDFTECALRLIQSQGK